MVTDVENKTHGVRLSQREKLLMYLSGTFVFGTLTGTLTVKVLPPAYLGELSQLVMKRISEQDFVYALTNLFSADLIWLFLMFVCGFCVLGRPLAAIALFFRGVAYGALSSVYYAVSSTFSVMPFSLDVMLNAGLLIVACSESFIFSEEIFAPYESGSASKTAKTKALAYYVKYIMFTVISLIISALSAFFSCVMMKA